MAHTSKNLCQATRISMYYCNSKKLSSPVLARVSGMSGCYNSCVVRLIPVSWFTLWPSCALCLREEGESVDGHRWQYISNVFLHKFSNWILINRLLAMSRSRTTQCQECWIFFNNNCVVVYVTFCWDPPSTDILSSHTAPSHHTYTMKDTCHWQQPRVQCKGINHSFIISNKIQPDLLCCCNMLNSNKYFNLFPLNLLLIR